MIFDAQAQPEEQDYDRALRPTSFSGFIGQAQACENLQVAIQATRQRQEPLDHLLFAGPPGLGKTTLAHLIASSMESSLVATSGPALASPKDLMGTLTRLERSDVLFVDEIHRLPRAVEEYLYSAMEDSAIDVVLEQGPAGRSVRVSLAPFTLVGATTREGLLSGAFRSRFGLIERLDPYPAQEIQQILELAASRLEVKIAAEAAKLLADRSRGVPRVALRLLRRVRDLAQVQGKDAVDLAAAEEGLRRLRIDNLGLEEMDRRILKALIERAEPTGLKTLAAMVDEAEDTLEQVFEPHLLRCALILRTPRGRLATDRARQHLGLEARGNQNAAELPFD
ncbi:MAG: Holliday junction branch migration DNA helicase RuvB [Planctomycetota bacterium]|jgi:Holliday junction DNA helicase RuvB